ncbi:MAG: ChaN family lipoprotein [Planctomycetota bacterium]
MLLLGRLASHKRDHVATGVSNADSNSLTLPLEMFERDVQLVLDEYLSGLIVEKHFLKAARTWSNYESDYRPLVEFAKQNHLPVIAANAPRRYVNLVSREGMKALDDVQDPKRSGLPPLPYAEASKAYAAKFNDLMEQFRQERAKANQATKSSQEVKVDLLPESDESDSSASAAIDDSPDAIAKRAAERSKSIQAQSLWDAAMAYSISERIAMNPDTQVLHICGSFHCENGLGIPEHLHQYRPETSFAVINIIASDVFPHFDSESMLESGTFVLVTDNALPRSYEASAGKE